jgi:CRISPR-associated protein Csm5
MKLYLKTITPLHIGNGEKLYDLDYFIIDNTYFQFNHSVFYDFIKNENINADILTKWIEDNTITTDKTKTYARQRNIDFTKAREELRNKFKLINFAKRVNKEKEFLNYLKKDYRVIKAYINQDKNIKEKEIRGIIKNAENSLYIPGSSIKGAIRTALLFDYMNEHENSENVVNSFISYLNKLKQNTRDKNKIRKKFASELEQNAFYCGVENKGRIIYSDEKFDLFKLLSVSDGNITDDNALTLDNLDLYLVSKNKDTGKRYADKQPQAPTIEAVKENTFIEFEIDFNIDLLLTLIQHLKDDKIITKIGKDKFQKQWIGIETKLKNIFDIDIKNITQENKDEIKKQAINTIFNKVFDFSESQKEWDKNWFENFNANDFGNQHTKKINDGFNKVRNSNNLFHLGFGSGFTGITELLYLMENKDIKTKFKDVMEAFGIGDRPGNRGRFTANPDNFPKSKRLISRNDSIIPIGWTEIIYKELDIKEIQKGKTKREQEQQKKLENIRKQQETEQKAKQEVIKKAEQEKQKRIEEQKRKEQERIAEEKIKEEERIAFQREKERRLKEAHEKNIKIKAEKTHKILSAGLSEKLIEKSDFNKSKKDIEKYFSALGKDKFIEGEQAEILFEFIKRCIEKSNKRWKKFPKQDWTLVIKWLGKPTSQKWFDEMQK